MFIYFLYARKSALFRHKKGNALLCRKTMSFLHPENSLSANFHDVQYCVWCLEMVKIEWAPYWRGEGRTEVTLSGSPRSKEWKGILIYKGYYYVYRWCLAA